MKSLFLKTTMLACSVYFLTACSDTKMRFLETDVDSFKADSPVDGWIPGTTPTPTPIPTPVATPTPTPIPTPVATPTPTPIPTPVATPTPTPIPTPVATPTPTPIPTPVATPTPTPIPTPVATPTPTPIPTPVATPTPTPPPVATPTPTPTPPPVAKDDCAINGLSQKACYLMKIMELGCPLRDHTPANYQAPSRAEIIENLDRCDATIYPTTAPTAAQLSVIQRLIDPKDASFRKYIFTGLYYKPPYTDDFKKYFGIELYNAEYAFCDNNGLPPGSGSIQPPASGDGPQPLDKAYKAANVYAGQLNQCVYESKLHNSH